MIWYSVVCCGVVWYGMVWFGIDGMVWVDQDEFHNCAKLQEEAPELELPEEARGIVADEAP